MKGQVSHLTVSLRDNICWHMAAIYACVCADYICLTNIDSEATKGILKVMDMNYVFSKG